MKYFFTACIVFVVGALGLGLYFSGSPSTARAQKTDSLRVSNLSNTQNNIINFYRDRKRLPDSLAEVDSYMMSNFYKDPQTNEYYEYTKKSDTEFSLCATFAHENLDVAKNGYPYYYSGPTQEGIVGENTWNHAAGHVCFDRRIDSRIIIIQQPGQVITPPPVKG